MTYENDVVSIVLEQFEGKTFIHCDVKVWSKSTYQRLCGILVKLQKQHPVIYAYIPTAKCGKFAELFNFEWTGEWVELLDGEEYPVVRRG